MEVEFFEGEEVEVSSNEEGFEGAWFIATIVRQSERKNNYLVQYQSLVDETETKPLREDADVSHIRPRQPQAAFCVFKLNEVVDAFVDDGWWKGVITNVHEDFKYSVRFIYSNEEMQLQQSQLRVHMEWIDGEWVTPPQTQEITALTLKGESSQSSDPKECSSLRTDMAPPQTPSTGGEILWINALSLSRSRSGMMEAQSTPQKTDLPSYHVSSTQENMEKPNPNTVPEALRPSKKAREEAIEVPTCIKACHTRGTSVRRAISAQYGLSFQTAKGKRSKIQSRRARHPISSFQNNCVPSNTCKEKGKDDLEKNWLWKHSFQSSSHLNLVAVEAEQSKVIIGLAAPPLQCQEKQHPLAMSEMKEPLFVKGIKGINQTENVVKRKRGRPKSSGVKHKKGSRRSPTLGMPVQSKGTENEFTNTEAEGVHESSNTHSYPTQQDDAPLLIENTSLPFIKSSSSWKDIESKEIFKLIPQFPHFSPLEKENEELREGLALGYTSIFAALWERTCKVHLDDPKSMFENKLDALSHLEKFGFNVNPIRSRLEELLKIKDSYAQLGDRSKTSKREVDDKSGQFNKIEESITQLNRELQSLISEKKKTYCELAELQKVDVGIEESIQGARVDFESLIAAPL